MSDPKPLDLASLDTALQPVRFVAGGPEYAFRPLDGACEQLLRSLAVESGYDEKRKVFEEVVARCIPDAPREEIAALRFWKLDLLVTLAGEAVRTVEEYMGKFRPGPEAEASPSETRSDTPSPV